ncbi:AmmeMemoRadiSam system protein B [Hydrogenivirga sp.]
MERPRVRYLDAQPYGDKFLITDPFGVSEPVVVTPELVLVMSLMDGTKTEEEIREAFTRRTGMLLPPDVYREILTNLDRNYLLMNKRFEERINSMRMELLNGGVMRASHAGEAYPKESQSLRDFLNSSLKSEERENPLGILVPHMDMRVAIDTYGKVYGRVSRKPELVVILGVSHYMHEMPFSACPLDLETPLGRLETDREVIERLRDSFSYDIFQDILSYRKEHSIEFQAVFVKHLFPEAKALPLIVSYGEEEFLKDVARKIASSIEDRDVLVISSVDMSHVGRKFGDEASYDPSERDREYMGLLSKLDGEGAFNLLKKDNNRTRIDGQFTNFVFVELMKILGASSGREIDYQVYHEEPTDSKVSYAGMSFS